MASIIYFSGDERFMNIQGIHIQTVNTIPLEYLQGLMPKRCERSQKYLRTEDRLRCLGAGLLMHQVLGIEEPLLHYGQYGKPYAPGHGEFSISHGGNWAVVASDPYAVGVDIEPINPDNLDIAGKVFTPGELLWMQQDPLIRFHILWTIKESIMKATGLGMQLDPASFEVLPDRKVSCASGSIWHTAWMSVDGCVLACASERKIQKLEFKEIFF